MFWVLSGFGYLAGLNLEGGDERWRKSARSWHRRRAKRRVCTLFSERLSLLLVLSRRRMMSTHTGWTNCIAHGADKLRSSHGSVAIVAAIDRAGKFVAAAVWQTSGLGAADFGTCRSWTYGKIRVFGTRICV